MSAKTSIEWTATVHPDGTVTPGKTWNPVRGCSVISPGCVNCYAMKFAHRFSASGKPYHGLTKQTKAGPQWTGKVVTVEDALLEPLSWRKPARVFVNSMSDLFHEDVPDEFIDRVFAVMALAPQHTFQILTKRAERMRDYMLRPGSLSSRETTVNGAIWSTLGTRRGSKVKHGGNWRCKWPLPNVWLGVSCENQEQADKRIPYLTETPAAVRFVSYEPALGPIDFTFPVPCDGGTMPAIAGLDWIIYGGESGSGARENDIQWARDARAQCQTSGTYFFMKQLGSKPTNSAQPDGDLIRAYIRDRKGGDLTEWPEDLRLREFPQSATT